MGDEDGLRVGLILDVVGVGLGDPRGEEHALDVVEIDFKLAEVAHSIRLISSGFSVAVSMLTLLSHP